MKFGEESEPLSEGKGRRQRRGGGFRKKQKHDRIELNAEREMWRWKKSSVAVKGGHHQKPGGEEDCGGKEEIIDRCEKRVRPAGRKHSEGRNQKTACPRKGEEEWVLFVGDESFTQHRRKKAHQVQAAEDGTGGKGRRHPQSCAGMGRKSTCLRVSLFKKVPLGTVEGDKGMGGKSEHGLAKESETC